MVTESAYLRTCRALNWRTAQLRANGIEPLKLTDEHPHEPPVGFDFGVEPAEVYLRLVDEGTDNECWVVCTKYDPGARPFTEGLS